MRAICWLVGALVASITLVGSAIAAEPVDLLLVLASDVSHSIDMPNSSSSATAI
jgi:hypothetical protein